MIKKEFSLKTYLEILLYTSIFFLTLIPLALQNNVIFDGETEKSFIDSSGEYVNQEFSVNCFSNTQDELNKLDSVKFSEISISYRDVYVIPEYSNFICLGKMIDFSYSDNSLEIVIGFNQKVYTYYLNVLLIFSFTALFFLKPILQRVNLILLLYLMVYGLIFNHTYLAFYSVGQHPFEILYDPSIFLLPFYFKMDKPKHFDSVLALFFLFFKPSLFMIMVLVLFVSNDFTFKNTFLKRKLFFYMPIFMSILRLLSGFTDKLNVIWLSLLPDPLTGLTRYNDLQISLTALNCGPIEDFKHQLFFNSNSYLSCPVPFYNPLYQFIESSILIQRFVNGFSIIYFVIFVFSYIALSNLYTSEKELITLIFLSPVLSFLFSYGNFDIFTAFFGFLSLYFYKKHWVVSSLIILFISINEIHPVGLILGLIIVSIIDKNYKSLTINVLSFSIYIRAIILDDSVYSIKNSLINSSETGIDFSYIGNIGVAYGLLIDNLNLDNLIDIPPVLISFIILVICFIFAPQNSSLNTSFSSIKNNHYIFIPLIVWYLFTLGLANNSYRIVNFLVLFIILFMDGSKFQKLSIVFLIFFTPNSLIYGDLIFYLEILINRVGIYFVGFICVINFKKYLYEFLKSNSRLTY